MSGPSYLPNPWLRRRCGLAHLSLACAPSPRTTRPSSSDVGASGSGKSSLVGAGLIPRLMDNTIPGSKDWLWARLTPGEVGSNPFGALAVALKLELPTIRLPDLAAKLWQQPALLINTVETALEGQLDWVELLLFI